MQAASDDMEFERAARLRDRIRALASIAQETADQPRDRGRGRRLRPARRGRPGLRAGVLLPRRPELGQPRLLPARRQAPTSDAEIMDAFLGQFYDDKPIPQADPGQHRAGRARAAGRGLLPQGRPQGGDRRPAARREAPAGRPRPDQRPRGAGPQDGRELGPDEAAGRGLRGLRPGGAAGADRGLRQLPHHGHQRRRRHDRRRARRLPEEPVPQVQHQERPSSPPATTTA